MELLDASDSVQAAQLHRGQDTENRYSCIINVGAFVLGSNGERSAWLMHTNLRCGLIEMCQKYTLIGSHLVV